VQSFCTARLVAERALLDLATGLDLLILVLADQPVAGDRLEVGHAADRTDVPPGPFDAEEPIQQELVRHVREDAADIDRRRRSCDSLAEREPQDSPVIAERPPVVSVGPGRFEQQFLEVNPALEPPVCGVEDWFVEVYGHPDNSAHFPK